MIDKIWFVSINGKAEGPFSYSDLKEKTSLTLETYVWKNGFSSWKKLYEVPELKALISDSKSPIVLDGPDIEKQVQGESSENEDPGLVDLDPLEKDKSKEPPSDDLTLAIKPEPPSFLWWTIGLIVIIYIIVKFLF